MFLDIFRFKRIGYYNNLFREVPYKMPTVWTSPILAPLLEIESYRETLTLHKSLRMQAVQYLLESIVHCLRVCICLKMVLICCLSPIIDYSTSVRRGNSSRRVSQ